MGLTVAQKFGLQFLPWFALEKSFTTKEFHSFSHYECHHRPTTTKLLHKYEEYLVTLAPLTTNTIVKCKSSVTILVDFWKYFDTNFCAIFNNVILTEKTVTGTYWTTFGKFYQLLFQNLSHCYCKRAISHKTLRVESLLNKAPDFCCKQFGFRDCQKLKVSFCVYLRWSFLFKHP